MIPYGQHLIEEDDIEAVAAQMRSGWLTQGPRAAEFECAIAEYVGARYAVVVSSATAGLHIACLAAGMSDGDRGITSPISFVASANCFHYAGGFADFSDVEADSVNMDADALEACCRVGTPPRVVMPVHFAGLPCDMHRIEAVSRRFGAFVVEDAAHALGSTYATGERVGSCAYSDMTVFSFHPVKSIACGEGGAITTNREDLYRRLLRLRSHGINKLDDPFENPSSASSGGLTNRWYYEMQELGFNFRLSDIHAALGLSQLRKLDRFLARRRELVSRYHNAFRGGSPIRSGQVGGWGESANHLFVIRVPFESVRGGRSGYMQRLFERGYVTQVHYIPIPTHPFYAKLGCRMDSLPQAAKYYSETLSVPLFAALSDSDQRRFISDAVECLA